jgi:signal peptidase I
MRTRTTDGPDHRARQWRERLTANPLENIRPSKIVAVWLLAVIAVAGASAWLGTFPPFMTVMTSSMEPTFHPGDVAVMQTLRGHTPKVGEIVEIHVPKQYQSRYSYPSRVVHRVFKVEDGWVTTKGDNVGDPDPFKTRATVVTERVRTVIPSAGRIKTFLFSPFGLLWLAGGALLFLVLPLRDAAEDRRKVQERSNATVEQLLLAVSEYGKHLESHTAVVKGMSEASQSLAAVVAHLEQRLETKEEDDRRTALAEAEAKQQQQQQLQAKRSKWWSRLPRRNTM